MPRVPEQGVPTSNPKEIQPTMNFKHETNCIMQCHLQDCLQRVSKHDEDDPPKDHLGLLECFPP